VILYIVLRGDTYNSQVVRVFTNEDAAYAFADRAYDVTNVYHWVDEVEDGA